MSGSLKRLMEASSKASTENGQPSSSGSTSFDRAELIVVKMLNYSRDRAHTFKYEICDGTPCILTSPLRPPGLAEHAQDGRHRGKDEDGVVLQPLCATGN